METNVWLRAVIPVLILCGGLSAESGKTERTIEEGLVEVGSVNEVFDVERTQSATRLSLTERMAYYGVPGVGVAIIDDYQVASVRSFGLIRADSEQAVTSETPFEAASTTKLLATVLALRLVEQGKLKLDDDVNLHLKSWRVPENSLTRDQKVTLRLLLTHRAGINRPEGGIGHEEGSVPSLVQVLKGEPPAQNKPAIVEFVPGSQHQYSNFGYLVIQQLLEDLLDKPYSTITQEVLFKPLSMESSTLIHPLAAEVHEKVALPHDDQGKPHDRPQHPTALAQGGLVTTPSDLARLTAEILKAYQGGSDLILSQQTAKDMFRTELALDPDKMMGISGQGLGVFLLGEPKDGHFYFLHPGYNMPGSNCFLIASPQTGKGAVIMSNGAAGMPLSLEILAAIAEHYNWSEIR